MKKHVSVLLLLLIIIMSLPLMTSANNMKVEEKGELTDLIESFDVSGLSEVTIIQTCDLNGTTFVLATDEEKSFWLCTSDDGLDFRKNSLDTQVQSQVEEATDSYNLYGMQVLENQLLIFGYYSTDEIYSPFNHKIESFVLKTKDGENYNCIKNFDLYCSEKSGINAKVSYCCEKYIYYSTIQIGKQISEETVCGIYYVSDDLSTWSMCMLPKMNCSNIQIVDVPNMLIAVGFNDCLGHDKSGEVTDFYKTTNLSQYTEIDKAIFNGLWYESSVSFIPVSNDKIAIGVETSSTNSIIIDEYNLYCLNTEVNNFENILSRTGFDSFKSKWISAYELGYVRLFLYVDSNIIAYYTFDAFETKIERPLDEKEIESIEISLNINKSDEWSYKNYLFGIVSNEKSCLSITDLCFQEVCTFELDNPTSLFISHNYLYISTSNKSFCVSIEEILKIINSDTIVNEPGIILTAPKRELKNGETMQLTSEFTKKDETNYIQYESSNMSIATVDQDGLVKALGEGTVTITTKLVDKDGNVVTGENGEAIMDSITVSCTSSNSVLEAIKTIFVQIINALISLLKLIVI